MIFTILPWWLITAIYILVFTIVALVFRSIDWWKIIRKEDQNTTIGIIIYMIFVLGFTFMIGSLVIIFTGVPLSV